MTNSRNSTKSWLLTHTGTWYQLRLKVVVPFHKGRLQSFALVFPLPVFESGHLWSQYLPRWVQNHLRARGPWFPFCPRIGSFSLLSTSPHGRVEALLGMRRRAEGKLPRGALASGPRTGRPWHSAHPVSPLLRGAFGPCSLCRSLPGAMR